MVTCPTFRYLPALVAQKPPRSGCCPETGSPSAGARARNLNEHVVGGGWPAPRVRHERLSEPAQITRALFTGEYVSFTGCRFEVERAKLYDPHDTPVPIGIAVSGPDAVSSPRST